MIELGDDVRVNAVAVSKDGQRIAITNSLERDERKVIVFDRDGTVVQTIDRGLLCSPNGLAFAANESIVVTESWANRVHAYYPDGTHRGFYRNQNMCGQIWWNPTEVIIDARQDTVIVGGGGMGDCLDTLRFQGFGLGGLRRLCELQRHDIKVLAMKRFAVTEDAIYAIHQSHGGPTISIFSRDNHNFIGECQVEGNTKYFTDIAINNDGNVLVADSWQRCIHVFRKDGTLLTSIEMGDGVEPTRMAASGDVVAIADKTDKTNHRIFIYRFQRSGEQTKACRK
jgi:sugar lactone lactonase YvrE